MTEQIIIFAASKLHIILAVIGVVYFLFANVRQKVTLVVLGATALPLAYLLGKIAGMLWVTQRPFVILGVQPLVEHAADNGFPSEHTLYALVIAVVIWSVHKKLGTLLLVLALAVGIGRVFAYVHNPIDILGSALVTLFVFQILARTAILAWRKRIEEKLRVFVEKYTQKS